MPDNFYPRRESLVTVGVTKMVVAINQVSDGFSLKIRMDSRSARYAARVFSKELHASPTNPAPIFDLPGPASSPISS